MKKMTVLSIEKWFGFWASELCVKESLVVLRNWVALIQALVTSGGRTTAVNLGLLPSRPLTRASQLEKATL